MSFETDEAEVSTIEYVGPHPTRLDLYQINVTVQGSARADGRRLCLVFRPGAATQLAHWLRSNPLRTKAPDHLEDDLRRVET